MLNNIEVHNFNINRVNNKMYVGLTNILLAV